MADAEQSVLYNAHLWAAPVCLSWFRAAGSGGNSPVKPSAKDSGRFLGHGYSPQAVEIYHEERAVRSESDVRRVVKPEKTTAVKPVETAPTSAFKA